MTQQLTQEQKDKMFASLKSFIGEDIVNKIVKYYFKLVKTPIPYENTQTNIFEIRDRFSDEINLPQISITLEFYTVILFLVSSVHENEQHVFLSSNNKLKYTKCFVDRSVF